MDLRIVLSALLIAMPPCAAAQLAAVTNDDIASAEQPEEIVVRGQRYRFQLRLQMQEAEREVYNVFNQFNDDKQFKIDCDMHQITGTRLASQVCQPAFEREALAMEAVSQGLDPANQGYSPFTEAQPSSAVIAAGQRQLQRKMREVAAEHPEFVDALIRFTDAKAQYEAATSLANE
jgi:hypothetical protein